MLLAGRLELGVPALLEAAAVDAQAIGHRLPAQLQLGLTPVSLTADCVCRPVIWSYIGNIGREVPPIWQRRTPVWGEGSSMGGPGYAGGAMAR